MSGLMWEPGSVPSSESMERPEEREGTEPLPYIMVL